MKDDTKQWLYFSKENFEAAEVLLESNLYNPSLQNVQQSVEKALKSLFIEYGFKLKKSHNIGELKNILVEHEINLELNDDECELLDSIYLPSKYPIGSVLPFFYPDQKIVSECISIAKRVYEDIVNILS